MAKGSAMLTREGRAKLCDELEILKGDKRREIAKDLSDARDHGDLSENAEYDAAKEAQASNEKRIAELEEILISARILDDSQMAKDEALIGAKVKVKDIKTNDVFDYMLVAEEESDFENNKISISSPVGRALMGHKVKDIVDINVPSGVLQYEIVEISR